MLNFAVVTLFLSQKCSFCSCDVILPEKRYELLLDLTSSNNFTDVEITFIDVPHELRPDRTDTTDFTDGQLTNSSL